MSGCEWQINDQPTYRGTRALGLLMNVRMVNSVFEDRHRPEFDPDANTREVPVFTERVRFAWRSCRHPQLARRNARLRRSGQLRVRTRRLAPAGVPESRGGRVIEACDRQGMVIILGCFYQRQDQVLESDAAVRAGG